MTFFSSSPPPLFCAMSDNNDGHGRDTDRFHVADSDNDDVTGSTDLSQFDLLKPLTTIWDCPQLNLAMCEVEDGKIIAGWTCGHCP
jgi:hypothetical protein